MDKGKRPSRAIIHSDGASSGNPGPAGIGAVIEFGSKRVEVSKSIGISTNNVAEYQAMIEALEVARREGAREVSLHLDSELVVKQLLGEYRVKNEGLKPFFQKASELLGSFDSYEIRHVRREENREADSLAKRAVQKAN
jgi:ribonuclease HI